MSWIKSIRSKLTKTLFPLLFEDVSIYMKALPTGGKEVAPLSLDGELDFVDLKKFVTFPLFFYHYKIYANLAIGIRLRCPFS